ncbi:MAG: NADH-quinone oxidoreductase subunit M, partial [Myxococcota bacterium]
MLDAVNARPRRSFPLRLGAILLVVGLTLLVPLLLPRPVAGGEEDVVPLLNVLVGLPLVGGLALMFLPRQAPGLLRRFSYAIFALTFGVALLMLRQPLTAGWSFAVTTPWIEPLGIHWHLAVDGLSLW